VEGMVGKRMEGRTCSRPSRLNRKILCYPQNLKVGSLRYPGGEKADAIDWNYAPHPVLGRVSSSDWPASDSTYYDLRSNSYVGPLLDFDQFNSLAESTGAEPYVVLAYDSGNRPPYPGGSYTSLQDLKVLPGPFCPEST
jgi:alpha-L-arabinofuranosidase